MATKWNDKLRGFILGYGTCYNPAQERIGGNYRWIGLVDEDNPTADESGWIRIMPYCEEFGWLEKAGPGLLIFIPDDSPSSWRRGNEREGKG